MIGLLRAFAWLRWRLFVNGLRGQRRDSFEQVSRVSRLLVGAIVAVSLVPGSILLATVAFVGGHRLAAGNEVAMVVTTAARAVLAVVTIVVAISPLLRFGGAAASTTRIALLPVPRRVLFAAELATQLADPWLLALMPALVALPSGLLAGGAVGAAAWTMAGGCLVLAVLATLGSTASLLGALLFRNRRLGELASVGVLLLITALVYVPVLTTRGTVFDRPEKLTPEQRRAIDATFAFDVQNHPWMAAAPWELYARTIENVVPPAGDAPLVPIAGLALVALVLGGVSRVTLGRLMDAPGHRRVRARRGEERVRLVPGLSPAASAIARTTFRLLTRSVRGRIILFTSPLPAFAFAILWRGRSLGSLDTAYTGVFVLGVTGILAIMSLSTYLADQFAADRAGLTLTFLNPVSGREIVAGKAMGAMAAFAIPLGIATAIAVILHPRGSPLVWAGALTCVFAAFVAQSPFAAAIAAWFPAPFDLSRLRGGNPHPLASVLGTLAAVIAYAACGGIFAATVALTRSPLAGLAAATVILVAAAGIARLGWPLAARALEARRENLAMIAQGR